MLAVTIGLRGKATATAVATSIPSAASAAAVAPEVGGAPALGEGHAGESGRLGRGRQLPHLTDLEASHHHVDVEVPHREIFTRATILPRFVCRDLTPVHRLRYTNGERWEGQMVHGPEDIARYRANGWWGTASLADRIATHAASTPGAAAFITAPAGATSAADATVTTWHDYDESSTTIARALVATGIDRGQRIAVIMPDGPTVHEAFVGVEKAGLVTVGIGARAGDREVSHLMQLTGATSLLTLGDVRGRPAGELPRGDGGRRRAGRTPPHGLAGRRAGSSGGGGRRSRRRPRQRSTISPGGRWTRTSCRCSTRPREPPACRSASCTTRTGGSTSTTWRWRRASCTPTTCSSARCPPPSGSGCGPPTTHRPRSALRPC